MIKEFCDLFFNALLCLELVATAEIIKSARIVLSDESVPVARVVSKI